MGASCGKAKAAYDIAMSEYAQQLQQRVEASKQFQPQQQQQRQAAFVLNRGAQAAESTTLTAISSNRTRTTITSITRQTTQMPFTTLQQLVPTVTSVCNLQTIMMV